MVLIYNNLSKQNIIDEIQFLSVKLKDAKLKIKVSVGNVIMITKSGRIMVSDKSSIFGAEMSVLSNEDLIIVLKYLRNIDACRDIAIKEIVYEDIFDINLNDWVKVPVNKFDVGLKIKEYLKNKKNKAVVDKRLISDAVSEDITKAGKYIKSRLTHIRNQYSKNADLCYDLVDKKFIIIIDRYDESPFGMNILHLMSETITRFRIHSYALTMRDYKDAIVEKKLQKLIYF